MKTGKKYGFKYNFYKYRRIFSAKKARLYKKYDTSYNTSFDRSKLSSNAGFYTVFNAVKSHMTSHPIYHYSGVVAGSFILGLLIGKLATPVSQSQALATISADTNAVSTSVIESVSTPEKVNISELGASATVSTTKSTSTVTQKPVEIKHNQLYIPKLGIDTNIVPVGIVGKTIPVPSNQIGINGTLLVGHNPGVFSSILSLRAGDTITLYGTTYQVYSASDYKLKSTSWLTGALGNFAVDNLNARAGEIVLMTCTGSYDPALESMSHRRLVFARAI